MKYIKVMFCIAVGCTSPCMGQEIYKYFRGSDGSRIVEQVFADELQPQTNFHAYDNWRDSFFGGETNEARGIYRAGAAEIADDLVLVTRGPSLITDIGFSIVNTSFTTITRYRVTHRFYNSERVLLGFDSFTIDDAPIQPGPGVAFYSDGGFYAPFGIVVPPRVFMSIQVTDVVGADSGSIGAFFVGPRTLGYSSQFAYNFTNGATINLDSSDQTNMQFFINTQDVPAPCATVVLLSGLVVSSRRRR